MEYTFSESEFKKNLKVKNKEDVSADSVQLLHIPDKKFKLFPYKATGKSSSPIVYEMEEVISSFFKLILDIETDEIEYHKLCDTILNKLEASNEDSLIRAINIYLSVEKEEIVNAQNDVKESIIRSQKLREEIEKCNIEGIQTYIDKKTSLLETKSQVSVQMQNETDEIESLARRYDEAIQILKREEKKFEDEVKTQSIGDLAERSIAFLDSLQKKLYVNEIAKVEILFIEKIKELARKSNFIDEIKIDNDFNIHIYKNITFNSKKVCKRIHEIGNAEYLNEYGQTHCQSILNVTKTSNLDEFVIQYGKTNEDFSVLQEIDKSRLSKGEKQVFKIGRASCRERV